MMQPSRPRGRSLGSLAAWSAGIGLAWLLLGHQDAGLPAVHLDLAAGLPGAATMHRQAPAPRRSAPARLRPTSPRSSQQQSTGTSPLSPHSPTGSPPTSTGSSQGAARAVAFALSQQGKPYRWGAEGPDAYDCSGLVWLAWQHAGLAWERMTAAGQWQWLHDRGGDVSAGQLRPGDLLFYANNPHDPATIHHVAMAIGHGRMVEAPAPGIPVRVVPLRWNGLFAAARPPPA